MTEYIKQLNPISKKLEAYFEKSKHKQLDGWLLDASWLIQSMEDEAEQLHLQFKKAATIIEDFNKLRHDKKKLSETKELIADYKQYFDKNEEWFEKTLDYIATLEKFINEKRRILKKEEISSVYQQYINSKK